MASTILTQVLLPEDLAWVVRLDPGTCQRVQINNVRCQPAPSQRHLAVALAVLCRPTHAAIQGLVKMQHIIFISLYAAYATVDCEPLNETAAPQRSRCHIQQGWVVFGTLCTL